jgi:hypothetical protein
MRELVDMDYPITERFILDDSALGNLAPRTPSR